MSFRATWAIAKKDLLDALRTLRLLIFILLPIGASLFTVPSLPRLAILPRLDW